MNLIFRFFFIIGLACPLLVKGQCDSLEKIKTKIGWPPLMIVVEEMPQFPGGDEARIKFLKENVKFPSKWPHDSITGKVFVSFEVDKQGEVKFPCVIKGIDSVLDSIALAAVKRMPKWIPAKQKGLPLECLFTLPVKFGIESQEKNRKRK